MEFNGRFLLGLIHFASLQGADKDELLKASGYLESQLFDESLFISAEDFSASIGKAIELTGDNYLGLHAGEYMNLSSSGLIGQITQTSSTIKEALDYCCAFANLGCRAIPKKLEEERDYFKLSLAPSPKWKNPPIDIVRHTVDGIIAFTLREFQTLTHQKFSPLWVQFDFEKPGDVSEYQRIYQCPLRFDQSETAIVFEKGHVNSEIVTKDYKLLRILVAHAAEKSKQLEGSNRFQNLVEQSLLNLVDPDFPTIEAVALNLNISVRTLQRRLKEEGFTFKEILESLRKDFALGYIKNKDLSINEIADLLCYADGSTFIRSFKRWTGKTPRVYREDVFG
jgi:AraC-like DNA-binding protein